MNILLILVLLTSFILPSRYCYIAFFPLSNATSLVLTLLSPLRNCYSLDLRDLATFLNKVTSYIDAYIFLLDVAYLPFLIYINSFISARKHSILLFRISNYFVSTCIRISRFAYSPVFYDLKNSGPKLTLWVLIAGIFDECPNLWGSGWRYCSDTGVVSFNYLIEVVFYNLVDRIANLWWNFYQMNRNGMSCDSEK